MSPLLQLALAIALIGAAVAFFFWKARGAKPDPKADRDNWQGPGRDGGSDGVD